MSPPQFVHAERPLLNSAKCQCNRTHDARLVIQTYNREVPVESVLRLFKTIGASYNGDAIQTVPGTS